MKWAQFLTVSLLGLIAAEPSFFDVKNVIAPEFFDKSFVIYTSEHDIVSLAVLFDYETDSDDDNSTDLIFFVESDIDNHGEKDYKGLYVSQQGIVTKLLDEGTDVTAIFHDRKSIYFSAKDGIYTYNADENKAEKYGSIRDSIIGIDKATESDIIYILTDSRELYKVTDGGNKKVKIDDVKYAENMALDHSNNLYYLDHLKVPYVVTDGGVKKISGLPDKAVVNATLFKPTFFANSGAVYMCNDDLYMIYPDGTSQRKNSLKTHQPTAFFLEATTVQYYASEGSIYRFNDLSSTLQNLIQMLLKLIEVHVPLVRTFAKEEWADDE